MANRFTAAIDFDPLVPLAGKLETLVDRTLLRISAADVVNEVAARFDAHARKGMNRALNLTDQYIAERMSITRAKFAGKAPPRAEIVARGDLTIIGHYPHAQLQVAGTRTLKGPTRGRRYSGVAVEITKGQAIDEPQWFTMRLRRGTQSGDKIGLFVRTSAGTVKHLYGPSPYSLFRYQVEHDDGFLIDDLEQTATTQMRQAIDKALT